MVASFVAGDIRVSPDTTFTEFATRLGDLPWSEALSRVQNVWFWSELLAMFFSKRRQAVHDLIGGTIVMRRIG